MKVSALDIARGRWQLDQPTHTNPCGCVWLLGFDRIVERVTRACERHRVAYTVVRPVNRH